MRKLTPYLLLIPSVFLIVVFKIYPILLTLIGSFLVKGSLSLANYSVLLKDPVFWSSFLVTVKFSIIVTPVQILLALILAFLVNTKLKGIEIFRTIYYLPVVVSIMVASMLWGIMLNPSSGVINSFLKAIGIPQQPFLTSSKQALMCIIAIASWKGIGYWMMFILAGLQNINTDIYEASYIDGASWWDTTTKITIPLLNRALIFVIVANTIINILLFVPMFVLTNGGPKMSTNGLMFEAYKSAFLYVDMGRSYAIVAILLVFISIVIGAQMKFLKNDY